MRLRLAIVTELFYPHVGGQEYRYFELSSHLAKRGHEVHVFTLKHDPALPSEEENPAGVTVYRYAYTEGYVKPGSRKISGVLKYALSTAFRLFNRRFDAYIFNQWPLLHILSARPFIGHPLVIDWCEFWRKGFINFLQRIAFKLGDAHLCVSVPVWRSLRRFFGGHPRMMVLPSGITLERYQPLDLRAKERGRLVFVGRLTPHKHVDMLIKAAAIARKTCSEIQVDIIGDGPLFHHLLENASKYGDFIRLHGWLPEEQKVDILRRGWLFILPSEREGFPRVVVEAMATGVPVITVDYPGNDTSKILSEYGVGVTVAPKPSAIAGQIVKLVRDEQAWLKLACQCISSAKLLDWKVLVGRFESFIYRLLEADGYA